VDFTNEMAEVARRTNPAIGLTAHVYPYFAPDPYYGHRLKLDTVGQTVAWFFDPHWPLDKVERLARNVVARDPHHAAPFVGFYARPAKDYRTPRRVRAEIELIRASGAEAIQFAELGNIISQKRVAQAVAEALEGGG